MKKDPFLDGSKPVRICPDYDLHLHWRRRAILLALVFFLLGGVLQWKLRLLP